MDCQAVHCSKGGCPEKCPQMPGRARHSRTLFLLLLSLYAGKIGNRLKNSFPACITGKKKHLLYADAFFHVRDKIRTRDLLVRSQTLYPAELHVQLIAVSSTAKLIIPLFTGFVNT